jgi:hypothetical protein
MKTITPKVHTYGFFYKSSEILALIWFILIVVLGLFYLYIFFDSLIAGYKFDIVSGLIVFATFIAGVIWTILILLFGAYIFPDIEIQNDGMKIRFLLKKYLIKWDEIIDIKLFRPFGLFTNKNIKVVVVKNNLTFIHRLYGLFYTGRYTPAVLIYRKISEYDLLMDNISTQVKNVSVESVSK